jgi:STE24 endopeptidase
MTNSFLTYLLQVLFLSCLILNFIIENYLYLRQIICLKSHRDQTPSDFSNFISLSEHQTAIDYSVLKLTSSFFYHFFNLLVFIYWFPLRGINDLYKIFDPQNIHVEILFLLCFFIINFLLQLPWSIYTTFFIEEKFGFNKTTPKLFFQDKIKSLILSFIILTPLLYAIFGIHAYFSDHWWILAFLTFVGFQFFILWIYPTFISPLFNKFSPLEDNVLKEKIMNLMAKDNFTLKEVFIMDASKRSAHGNAYFTGLGKNKRIVFFDTLIKELNHDEILAILAHELGHMKFKHIQKSIILSLFFSLIGFYLLSLASNTIWFFEGHFIKGKSFGLLLLIFLQVVPNYTYILSPFFSWFSRKNEFQSDRFAA